MTRRGRHRGEGGGIRGRVAAAAGVAVVAVGLLARATLADPSTTSFRTATVTTATVLQTLTRVGTIEPVGQATVAFPVSGTVAGVTAKVGDVVNTGQSLASLDTTAQSAELATRQAALAAAQLTLDQAVNGQSTSASGAATNGQSAASGTRGSSSSASASVDLAPAQDQVLNGQKDVDAGLRTARAAMGAATAACSAAAAPSATTAAATTSGGSGTSGTSGTSGGVPETTTTTVPTSGLGTSACGAAQQQALTSQQVVAASLGSLADAESALDSALARAVAASSAGGASGGGSSSGGSSARGSQQSGTSASTSSQSAPTAAQLVADQAAVDAAVAAVNVAQQAIDQATVVSPIAGTVAAVNLAPGQQVSAGSSTANIVVVGEGGWEVATTVGVDDVDKVKTGQTATVVPDGTGAPLDAKIVSVGVAATTSGTATTYPVVVGFGGSPTGLHNGASASVVIDLARAADALTVPTSAVHTVGTLHVVAVLTSGRSRTVPVQIGTVGSERTEVTAGLSAGQGVVLADLSQPLPASNTTNIGGGLGGLGGGGRLGGGGAGIRTGGGGRPGG